MSSVPETLPLLPVRDLVVFPYMILPLFVGRQKSLSAVDAALSGDRLIFLASQRELTQESPVAADIYEVGTVAMIMRMLKLPDGRVKVLVQGVTRARIKTFLEESPHFAVRLDAVAEPVESPPGLETQALMRTVREQLSQISSYGRTLPGDVLNILDNIEHPGGLADLVASHLDLKVAEAQSILEILEPVERLLRVKEFLSKELELVMVQDRIQTRAKEEMGKSQREYFLREQLRAIQTELGEADTRGEDVADFRRRLLDAVLPESAQKEADKQLRRLETMHPEAAEYSTVFSYLDWLADLPWSKQSDDNLDLDTARKVLDEDHFDLEKIKERILEFLAVCKLKKNMKGPILCFVGPPGVGKTSLGKSIARALGRSFVRISLGGIRDEAEIRGHRRTYVGAMPGRIIQGLKQAESNNPVFMLDELDKLGNDYRGDPSAALLELLDPEQNSLFSDHFINLPFDLSRVLFIVTANVLDPIPSALRDRLEVIRLAGYTADEKLSIARKYLIPRQLEANGLTSAQLKITDSAVQGLINGYTAEAGLRNLEREIGSVCRKVARKFASGAIASVRVTPKMLEKLLGPIRFLPDEDRKNNEVGLVNGLAWTEVGGELLQVEAHVMQGKGQLLLTGHLGEIMKESAQAALSYARAHAEQLSIPADFFERTDVHIHVPAGAIPKDGPSAGVTMATALVSALTGRYVRKDVAMTGEITLRGKVLPIGGLKEKVLAAVQAQITTLIVPERNRKDLEEIPAHLRKKIEFIFVDRIDQVFSAALLEAQ
ncbi:MAG: endopeptidase La [Desulfuromonadales bacterium]|nr:endopeptidase La [Desulfuromonadales bacterium]